MGLIEYSNIEWFDNKYRENGKIKIYDKAELLKNVDLKEKLEALLNDTLFKFQKKPDSRALEIICFELLSWSRCHNLSRQGFERYAQKYNGIIKKKEKRKLKGNYSYEPDENKKN